MSKVAALQRENAALRQTLDAIDGAVVIYDSDRRFVFANGAYHQLYPHLPPTEELIGRLFEDILRLSLAADAVHDPLARENPEEYITRRIEQIQQRGNIKPDMHGNVQARETYHSRSGRWTLLRSRVTVSGYNVTLRVDITALKELQLELDKACKVRDAALQAKDAVLESFRQPLVLLSAEGEVLFSNEAARALSLATDGLAIKANRLLTPSPSINPALNAAIRSVAREPERIIETVAIQRGSDRLPLQLAIRALPSGERGSTSGPRVAIIVCDPQHSPRPSESTLREVFGLTRGEAKLALALLEEGDLAGAAERLGIGRETAKTHLSRALGKTGAKRQAELIRMTLNLVPNALAPPTLPL